MSIAEKIPREVIEVANLVSGYVTGGSIRDIVMNREPNDYDISTPLHPEEVTQRLENAGYHVFPLGKQFGTVAIVLPEIGQIEITTFRGETYRPELGRKPIVEFGVSLDEDLARRDFTINAMTYDPRENKLIDPFRGKEDIERKRLKFVGDATERIKEDPLRMVRACRFESKLGFKIDDEDFKTIQENVDLLDHISIERIVEEMDKSSNNFADFIQCMSDSDMLSKIFGPEIDIMKEYRHDERGTHYGETIMEHSIDVIRKLDELQKDNLPLKLAGLMHDMGKTKTRSVKDGKIQYIDHEKESFKLCQEKLRKLKGLPKNAQKETCWIVRDHMRLPHIKGKKVAKTAIDYNFEHIPEKWIDDIIDFITADAMEDFEDLRIELKTAMKTQRPSGKLFLKYPPTKRKLLIRQKWIEEARRKIAQTS